jgi:hypothetical protein
MPTNPVLYWRDVNTQANLANTHEQNVDALIVSNPEQTLQFEENALTAQQLESIIESGDDPVTNEPGLIPDGTITVNKQQGRSPVPTLTLSGNVNVSESAWRERLRSFSYKTQVEFQFHRYGIIGFFHPLLTDFSKQPTDSIGYTMAVPFFQHTSGAELVSFRINLSLGARSLS